MKIAIIANSSRIDEDLFAKDNLDKLANENQLQYELYSIDPRNINTLLKNIPLQNFNAVLVAGGDGTVRLVAEFLINYDIPLAIFPLGTFNYFARELQYPTDLSETFKILKNKKLKKVDVAMVNNMVFINHSVIGFYAAILKARKKYKGIFKNYKYLKVLFTTLNFLKIFPVYTLQISTEDTITAYKTCMLFIGNNYHFTNFFDLGTRQSLSQGVLSVYIFNCTTRWETIKCLLSILFNTKNKAKYLTEFLTKHLIVSSQSKLINVDVDGEMVKLENPLEYSTLNKKLTVLVP